MVKINNNSLKNYLQIVLNKKIDDISETDLEQIKTVVFTGDLKEDDAYEIDITDLNLFKNADSISIIDSLVTLNNIELINNSGIKKLYLSGCALDNDYNLSLLGNISELEITNSFVEKYDFLTNLSNLEKLVIKNPVIEAKIDIANLNNNKSLKTLMLEKCNIINFNMLSDLKNIEYLDVILSVITDDVVVTLNSMPKLKDLFITSIHDLANLRTDINARDSLIEYGFEDPQDGMTK